MRKAAGAVIIPASGMQRRPKGAGENLQAASWIKGVRTSNGSKEPLAAGNLPAPLGPCLINIGIYSQPRPLCRQPMLGNVRSLPGIILLQASRRSGIIQVKCCIYLAQPLAPRCKRRKTKVGMPGHRPAWEVGHRQERRTQHEEQKNACHPHCACDDVQCNGCLRSGRGPGE